MSAAQRHSCLPAMISTRAPNRFMLIAQKVAHAEPWSQQQHWCQNLQCPYKQSLYAIDQGHAALLKGLADRFSTTPFLASQALDCKAGMPSLLIWIRLVPPTGMCFQLEVCECYPIRDNPLHQRPRAGGLTMSAIIVELDDPPSPFPSCSQTPSLSPPSLLACRLTVPTLNSFGCC